jgi:hypothetical protein
MRREDFKAAFPANPETAAVWLAHNRAVERDAKQGAQPFDIGLRVFRTRGPNHMIDAVYHLAHLNLPISLQ